MVTAIVLLLSILGCKPTCKVAVFDDIEFFANDHKNFFEMKVKANGIDAAHPLYAKIGNNPPMLLSELTEPVFGDLLGQAELANWKRYVRDPLFKGDRTERITYASPSGTTSRMSFEDGKLNFALFSQVDEIFSFSRSPDGPFVELGLTRSELKKAFGRPKRWETRTRGGV